MDKITRSRTSTAPTCFRSQVARVETSTRRGGLSSLYAFEAVTSGLLPGYLQSNGAPYSAKTTMTEYFDVVKEDNGEQWMLVESITEDPQYLFRTFVRSTHFKKLPDAAGWDPSPCMVR